MPNKKLQLQQKNNGFLIVASVSKTFYRSAVNLAQSILDFYPDAKITLCTQEDFFEESDRLFFDHVDLTAPNHTRAKLYALPRTKYDLTLYVDADCEVQHEDIVNVWDQIGNNDIVLTRIREYSGADVIVSKEERLYWHCGVFLYKRTPDVIDMMQAWWDNYRYQVDTFPWPYPEHSEKMRYWDQYTFWRLIREDKYKEVRIGIFPGEDARWNFVNNYLPEEVSEPAIIYHYTINPSLINAGR